MELVREAHEFVRDEEVKAKLFIHPLILNPVLKNHPPEASSKLGRYHAAASEPALAARDRLCRAFPDTRTQARQIQDARPAPCV